MAKRRWGYSVPSNPHCGFKKPKQHIALQNLLSLSLSHASESAMESVRVRLEFKQRHLLKKSQLKEGLKRSWFLLKPEIETISDLTTHLLHNFDLLRSCPNGLILFVIPSLSLSPSACPNFQLPIFFSLNFHVFLFNLFILVECWDYCLQKSTFFWWPIFDFLWKLHTLWSFALDHVLKLVKNCSKGELCSCYAVCSFLWLFAIYTSVIFVADGWVCVTTFWINLYFEGQRYSLVSQ